MFYGLSNIEETYLEKNLIKFIALAPCSVSTGLLTPSGEPDIAGYKETFFRLQDLGVYAVKGPNWDRDLKIICDNLDKDFCEVSKAYAWQPYSVQDELHWIYNFIEQRF